MLSSFRWSTVALIAPFMFALSACGGSSSSDGTLPLPDGSTGRDAGSAVDSGGTRTDGGSGARDSGGVDMDSGSGGFPDAMEQPDSGMMGGTDTGGGGHDGTTGHDGGTGQDGTVTMTDGGGPVDTGPACMSMACPTVVNLNTMGTRSATSATTRYFGNSLTSPVAGPLCLDSCGTNGFTGHQNTFSYTPRQSGRLLISTDYPQTNFDTVLLAVSSCGPGETTLACDDDAAPGDLRSAFTMTGTMGQAITVVVGGWGRTTTTATAGHYLLTVTEQTLVQNGGTCDPMGINNYCVNGSSCVTNNGASTCIPDGTQNGFCRLSPPACNTTLACNGPPASINSRCVPEVMAGGACDPAGVMNVCAPPNLCAGTPPTCQNLQYTESVLMNPTFIDACTTGTHVMGLVTFITDPRDDGYPMAPVMIPFNFSFYGMVQTMVWPVTNGYMVLGPTHPNGAVSDTQLPTANETEGAVFPLFQDLVLRAAPGSDMCYLTTGTAPNRKFAVEWLNVYAFGATAQAMETLTFEVVLNETTNTIDFVYQTLTAAAGDEATANGSAARIGIQSPGGASFTSHTGTVTVTNGLRYTP